jgi:hypothetical protein
MRAAWISLFFVLAAVSPVIFGDQRLPMQFDHGAHLDRGATCQDCHAAAWTSASAVDNLLPAEKACRTCHQIDRTAEQGCDTCHTGYVKGQPVARLYIPPAEIKFDHEAHVKRGAECAGCHGDLAKVGLATRDQLPAMDVCMACHEGTTAPDACSTCHLTDVGVMRTKLTAGVLEPDDHGLDWDRQHAVAATKATAACDACHRERDCSDCHTGITKPEDFHPADYEQTHAADARRNTPDCSTCHRAQTFCVGCHVRSGIGSADTEFDQDTAGARFHPEDWQTRHAEEARANIAACAACHREDDCLACHSAESGTPQVSPHGPGWRGSAKCEALSSKNPRMCERCHVSEDEQGCDW